MKKIIFTLFFALVLCGASQAQSKPSNAIEAELQSILNQKSDEMIDINIMFKSQINSRELESKSQRTSDRSLKREIVVNELKDFSSRNQLDVMSILQAEELNGNVKDINSLWIANAINCKATRDVVYQLATHPDVLSIGYNKEMQLIDDNKEIEIKDAPASRGGSAAPHVLQVGANQVWNQGYTGKNVIVAVLDSGTNIDHYDLKDHLWVGEVNGETVNGWNYISENSDIRDDYGHGTHCAGIVCGDGTVGNTVGVAPDATLMTLKIVNRAGGGSPSAMMSGVQFAVEHGAQVLSMSLGFKVEQIGVAASESLRATFVNALNAGVIVCAAAGNDGNNYGAPNNVDVPGACPPPYIHPDQAALNTGNATSSVVCVGAVDSYNNFANFTSQGPSTWKRNGSSAYNDYAYEGTSMGLIRPDICAPGDLIYSLKYDEVDKYKYMTGTSQATPCVAGVMALMLEKNPSLTPAQICQIIEETATNKPTTKNNQVGSGIINALNAVNEVAEGTQRPFITLQSAAPASLASGNGKSIRLSLKNTGKSASENTTATLSTDDPYITITSATQSLGTIAANSTLENVVFNINVSNDAPNGHTASFDILMSNGTLQWTSKFTVKIDSYAKIVYQSSSTYQIEATGNNTDISVKMINKGTAATTQNTDVTLSTSSSFVDVVSNKVTLGTMNVGEEKDATFTINIDPTTPDNATVIFNLQATPNNGLVTKNITYEFEAELDEYGYPTDGFNGWTTFDNSADGRNHPFWHSQDASIHKVAEMGSTHSGAGQLLSESYCQASMQQYTMPIDNFLVSPKTKASATSKMSFYARAHAGFPGERFKIMVSEASNNIVADFVEIASYQIKGTGYSEWKEYEVDLSAYAGKEIYVAIRHTFNEVQWVNVDGGMGVYLLHLDDITFHNVIEASDEFKYNNSSNFTIQVKSNPLPAPQNVTANGISTSSIKVTWDYVTNAQSYNIYRDGSYIGNVGGTSLSYTDNGLEPNTEYCYEVAAVYNNHEYTHSESVCARTNRTEYSVAINSFTPDMIYPGNGTIKLTLINDGLQGHESRSSVSLTTDNQYVTITTSGTGASITALDPDEVSKELTFDIAVSENIPHNSKVDFNVNVTYMYSPYTSWNLPISIDVINALGVPANVKANAISESSINISWDNAYKATNYNIYRDGIFVANTAMSPYVDKELYHNTEYTYTVTSVNGTEESEHSVAASATTLQKEKYIVVESVDVDKFNVGKNNTVIVTLHNEGSTAANNVIATLSCNNPNVIINNNDIELGTIEADATVNATFSITNNNAIEDNSELEFTVTSSYRTTGASTATTTYSFNSDFEGWTVIDGNGDGKTWSYHNNGYLLNYSYEGGAITPDDYIVAPFKVKVGSNTSLSFKAKSTASTARYIIEKFSVAISTTDNTSANSFTDKWTWDMNKNYDYKDWQIQDAWLAGDYAGQEIWIAIHHHDCSDGLALAIDEITIYNYPVEVSSSNTSSFSLTAVVPVNTFIVDGSWNIATNWSEGSVPTEFENVIIEANAIINSDVVANSVSISRGGASVTINGGSSLTATELINNNENALVIKDGAQLFVNNNVSATFEMAIANPTLWSESNKEGWQFIASPFTNAEISNFTETDTYDLYKYDGTKDLEWINQKVDDNNFEETFQQGVAYLASYQYEDFAYLKGIVNTEKSFYKELSYNTTKELANFHLIGNPFPFNMDWNDVKTTGLATGYAVVNAEGGYDYHTSGKINVGDGFFVKATADGASISYGMRGTKGQSEKGQSLNVIASGSAGNDNIVINFADEQQDGFPKLKNFNDNIANIFVSENDQRYGIYNCKADAQQVELAFEAKQMGNYSIIIEPDGKFDEIILIDRLENVEHNMLLENEYKFFSKNSVNNRFLVKFSLSEDKGKDEEHFVYQSGKELIIEAEGAVQIIDIMGRIVYSNDVENGNNRIDVSKFNSAAYIVRLINEDVKTQKIVIY